MYRDLMSSSLFRIDMLKDKDHQSITKDRSSMFEAIVGCFEKNASDFLSVE